MGDREKEMRKRGLREREERETEGERERGTDREKRENWGTGRKERIGALSSSLVTASAVQRLQSSIIFWIF